MINRHRKFEVGDFVEINSQYEHCFYVGPFEEEDDASVYKKRVAAARNYYFKNKNVKDFPSKDLNPLLVIKKSYTIDGVVVFFLARNGILVADGFASDYALHNFFRLVV